MSSCLSARSGLLTILPSGSHDRGCPWFGPAKSGCERQAPLRICIDECASGDAVNALNQLTGVGDVEIFITSQFNFHPDAATTPNVLPVSCSADNSYFGVYFLDGWNQTVRALGEAFPGRSETELRDALRRALAAANHGAHIYATDDPAMNSAAMRHLPGTRMSTRQSAAMAGLYLRAWNETAVFRMGG